jgi:poly-gamma-glutamate synthesis protein (capsule biosynthesis protein)
LFGDIIPIVKQYDRFVVNLECALTDSDGAITKKGPNLKASPKCVNGLIKSGVTDVLLSNNHTFDFGEVGLRDTMKALDEGGIPYTGVGENDTDSRKIYYLEKGGIRVAIVNVCEHEYSYALPDRMGTNPFDPFITMQDIREARKNAHYVVAVYHGGKEFSRYPSPRLVNLAHEMVYCGASVVLMQHSHCIGSYEEFEGGSILYGQGNLNFVWQGMEEGWETAMLVGVDFSAFVPKVTFYPIVMNEHGVELAKGDVNREILLSFNKRMVEMKNGEWYNGWREFCFDPKRDYYLTNTAKSFTEDGFHEKEIFPHYLDCEAHTDVLRERFATWHKTLR